MTGAHRSYECRAPARSGRSLRSTRRPAGERRSSKQRTPSRLRPGSVWTCGLGRVRAWDRARLSRRPYMPTSSGPSSLGADPITHDCAAYVAAPSRDNHPGPQIGHCASPVPAQGFLQASTSLLLHRAVRGAARGERAAEASRTSRATSFDGIELGVVPSSHGQGACRRDR